MGPLACVCLFIGICALVLNGCDGQNCCQPKTTQPPAPPPTRPPVVRPTRPPAPSGRMGCGTVLEQVYCELKFLIQLIGLEDADVNCQDFLQPSRRRI
ncbi:hypothetical protein CSKR_201878 [Clonorchis sinensis]|uniref:Uncharacterized protein n=1 Tax=Clonorchis sinensis TaxID=79923 RepID=A0A8T1MYE5_CLOSI|nr:hypothetical protein CSKR_201871 [Clonorchis sinensis]KAG5453949.1 hypothetical protein CSKR_201872 [Clonorchis sinensis]KAG5453978.1 hypothetical protein CSKR_201878 [Clonorchis sinensis]